MSSPDRPLRLLASAMLLLAALSFGCVEHALFASNRPGDYEADPLPEQPEPEPGAIYRGDTASGSFLFFDRKARGTGDLLTVLIVEDFAARGSAGTSLGSSRTISAGLNSQLGFTDLLQGAAHWFFGLFGADPGPDLPAGTDLNVLQSNTGNDFEGDGLTTRQGSFTGVVTCRVVKVLPRGVFHILGRRSIIVNHEEQVLTVEGLVRREDIGINNTVLSSSIAEAKLAFDGQGVIDDKQRPSIIARMFDWLYPF